MSAPAVSTSLSKRLIDLVVAVAIFVFFLPAFLLIGLILKLEKDGPALVKLQRTGLNGRQFPILRFRTDTAFGKVLRQCSLDAMPQILNIVFGDMSLVGPRALDPRREREFSALLPNYRRRYEAAPGLTGLAEARGLRGDAMSRDDLEKRLACDLEYIETWSIGLDITTLMRALPRLFAG